MGGNQFVDDALAEMEQILFNSEFLGRMERFVSIAASCDFNDRNSMLEKYAHLQAFLPLIQSTKRTVELSNAVLEVIKMSLDDTCDQPHQSLEKNQHAPRCSKG